MLSGSVSPNAQGGAVQWNQQLMCTTIGIDLGGGMALRMHGRFALKYACRHLPQINAYKIRLFKGIHPEKHS